MFRKDNNEISAKKILKYFNLILSINYIELILKRLLKAAIDLEEKDFCSFENLKSILKEKGIKLSDVTNFNEINNLRKVNNHIKHSKIRKIPNDLKQIPEFKNEKNLSYVDLKKFHKRVKNLRYGFISNLKFKIFDYLYEFNDDRIQDIAKKYLERMDSNQVKKLIFYLENMD